MYVTPLLNHLQSEFDVRKSEFDPQIWTAKPAKISLFGSERPKQEYEIGRYIKKKICKIVKYTLLIFYEQFFLMKKISTTL